MLHYRVVERKNPAKKEEPGLYYGCLVNPGIIDIEGLAKRISATCTVTRADTLAVLTALQEQVIYALQSGMRVHFGDIGSFRLTCQGEGVDAKENFKVSQITSLKVVFTPNKALKEAIAVNNKDISFYNIETSGTDGTDETGGGAGV